MSEPPTSTSFDQPCARRHYEASVVIPAYNEAALIQRCLESLKNQEGMDHLHVVVVANGCTDDTADRARAVTGLPSLTVLELAQGSKIAALNAGDDACSIFPRVYLDADIALPPTTIRTLCDALADETKLMAVPRAHFDTSESSWPVAAFWTIFEQLPYASAGAAACVYALNKLGRDRFGAFPDVTADDLFVHERFEPIERVTVNAPAHVLAPRTLAGLLAIRTRVARGNAELAAANLRSGSSDTGQDTASALVDLVRRKPYLAPHAAVYAAVAAYSRYRAAQALEQSGGQRLPWERDNTIR